MARIEHSIDIAVPVREAYDQWTQFESFPQFMEGVDSVNQTDPTHLHWVATIAGKRQEWDAEIIEQTPDRRIAWTSRSGDANAGSVDFHRLGEERTRVVLTMDVEPSGVAQAVGTALGVPSSQVKRDLERFREFIERRGTATGAWRGSVDQGELTGQHEDDRRGATDEDLAATAGMRSSRTAVPGDEGAVRGGATADDPYGIGAGSTLDDAGTPSGDRMPGETGSGINNPHDLGTGRRETLDR